MPERERRSAIERIATNPFVLVMIFSTMVLCTVYLRPSNMVNRHAAKHDRQVIEEIVKEILNNKKKDKREVRSNADNAILTAASFMNPNNIVERDVWDVIADASEQKTGAALTVALTTSWQAAMARNCKGQARSAPCIASLTMAVLSGSVAIAAAGNAAAGLTARGQRDLSNIWFEQVGLELEPYTYADNARKRDDTEFTVIYTGTIELPAVNVTAKYQHRRGLNRTPIVVAMTGNITHTIVSAGDMTANDLIIAASRGLTFLGKRWDFEVDWMSYNYDLVDSRYAKTWMKYYNRDSSYDVSAIYGFLQKYPNYKMCLAALAGMRNGKISYDTIGYMNVMKGEIYYNAYGGIDSPCLDDKDGADM